MKKRIALVLLCLLFQVTPVTAETISERSLMTRIIGGEAATAEAWPWMVALLSNSGGSVNQRQFCGGTLISTEMVMTAAHCVEDLVATDLSVFYGTHDLSDSSGTEIQVAEITLHEQYDPYTAENDIALLKLVSPLSSVSPLGLATDAMLLEMPERALFTTVGWGTTSTSVLNTVDQLQQVELPPVTQAMCNLAYPGEVSDKMICAGFLQGGKDSCQGDSGGPLLMYSKGEWYQTGIVSWGKGCAEPLAYGVYTRIPSYLSWIDKWMPQNVDQDEDGIPDYWEQLHFDNLVTANGTTDQDGDGLSDLEEYSAGTDPQLAAMRFDSAGSAVPATAGWGAPASSTVNWSFDSAVSVGAGGGSLRSGSIADGERSQLQLEGEFTEGVVRFAVKVSSEDDFDKLVFEIDDQTQEVWSGERAWSRVEFPISAGVHTLRWSYSKDGRISDGSDSAWIDDIEVAVTPLVDSDGDGWSDHVETIVGSSTTDSNQVPQDQDGDGIADLLDADDDGDGIDDEWELYYFFDLNVASGAVDSDQDGDGVTDLAEFLAQSNPRVVPEEFEGELPAGWSLTVKGEPLGWEFSPVGSGGRTLQTQPIGDNQRAVMQYEGYLESGTIRFNMKVSSEERYDFLKFEVDGVVVGEWSGEMSWNSFSHSIEAGHHQLRWIFVKDSSTSVGEDRAWIDAVELPWVSAMDSDKDGVADVWEHGYWSTINAIDATTNSDGDMASDRQEYEMGSDPQITAISFESEEALPLFDVGVDGQNEPLPSWSRESGSSYFGEGRFGSSAITDGEAAIVNYIGYFPQQSEVRFALKVSSEENYDLLQFLIDGTVVGEWSGYVDWKLVDFVVEQGLHTLQWRYSKDLSISDGEDRAWIDWLELSDARGQDSDQDRVPDSYDQFPNHLQYMFDADGDGIPDEWEQYHFDQLTVVDAVSDYDRDGRSDLNEWRFGSDPLFSSDYEGGSMLNQSDYNNVELNLEWIRGDREGDQFYQLRSQFTSLDMDKRIVDTVTITLPDDTVSTFHETSEGVWSFQSDRYVDFTAFQDRAADGEYTVTARFIDGHEESFVEEVTLDWDTQFPQLPTVLVPPVMDSTETLIQWISPLSCAACNRMVLKDVGAMVRLGESQPLWSSESLGVPLSSVTDATETLTLPAGLFEESGTYLIELATTLEQPSLNPLMTLDYTSATLVPIGGAQLGALSLTTGWNLIGGQSIADQQKIEAFLTEHGAASVWSWTGTWESFVLSTPVHLNSLEKIVPEKGYFVKVE